MSMSKPCKYGHTERYANGKCVQCVSAYNARYHAKWYPINSEKKLAANAKWRAANPEKQHAYQAKWRVENPEYLPNWKRENALHCAMYQTLWYADKQLAALEAQSAALWGEAA